MADLSELPDDLSKFATKVAAFTTKQQREVALTLTRELVQRTPKRTGRAAGNWNVGVNRKPSVVIRPPISNINQSNIGRLEGSRTAFVQKRLAVATKRILTANLDDSNDPVIYITNNVEYINLLNTTKPSPQMPPGWIESSVRFAVNSTKKTRIE